MCKDKERIIENYIRAKEEYLRWNVDADDVLNKRNATKFLYLVIGGKVMMSQDLKIQTGD